MEGKPNRYLVDDQGNRIAFVFDLQEYSELLEQVEELQAIRAYDAAKAENDEAIPFEQAVAEIRARPEWRSGCSFAVALRSR